MQGFDDTSNVSRKLREGWEFVRADTIVSELGKNDYPTISEGKHQGLSGIGGLVLARIQIELLEAREAYFEKITQDRMKCVDSE